MNSLFRWFKPAAVAVFFAYVGLNASVASASNCAELVGRRVILAADAVDPDVFLWDRRFRMIDYAAGIWMSTREVFDHTLLEKPGTRAVVIACGMNQVHPRYSIPSQDAVGLRLLSGPDQGRYGWAVEEDVHSLR